MLVEADRLAIDGCELTLYDDRKPLAVFRAATAEKR